MKLCKKRSDRHIVDRLSEKLSIMEACVFGAMDNIQRDDPNSDIIDGLYFSFRELKDTVDESLGYINE
jgi:hypothetical protein